VQQGTLAPIEATRAQAQVASARQDVINAEALVRQQELILKNVLTRNWSDDPVLYDGSMELVLGLRGQGVRTGVLTNKIGDNARAVLGHLGIAQHMELILGARDCPWRKPSAEFTAEALRRIGGEAASTCLIGDSPFDVETARNAGFPCFCVTTGTHGEEALRSAGAAAVYPGMRALASGEFGLSI